MVLEGPSKAHSSYWERQFSECQSRTEHPLRVCSPYSRRSSYSTLCHILPFHSHYILPFTPLHFVVPLWTYSTLLPFQHHFANHPSRFESFLLAEGEKK